jgi:hypothetical protein
MKKNVVAFLSALIIPTVAFAASPMRDGYWEMTTTMEMPGMPMQIPPTQVKQCYTREDVKDYKKAIATNEDCTVTDLKESGNKITWKMKCKDAGESSGATVFDRDSYETKMTMQAEGMDMTVNVKARRLGDCP